MPLLLVRKIATQKHMLTAGEWNGQEGEDSSEGLIQKTIRVRWTGKRNAYGAED